MFKPNAAACGSKLGLYPPNNVLVLSDSIVVCELSAGGNQVCKSPAAQAYTGQQIELFEAIISR